MNTLYLRNDGYAVEPTMNVPEWQDGYNPSHARAFRKHLSSLPGILVHPSYLENHKVGFMPDDWEERYERINDLGLWEQCGVEKYETWQSIFPTKYRKVIIPRSSNVEGKGEVSANYMQVVPNSHSWADFPMLLRFLEGAKSVGGLGLGVDVDYLITGLKNSIAATHPLQGEDKREEVPQDTLDLERLFAILSIEYGLMEFPWTEGERGMDRVITFLRSRLTTPSNKEGERGEKEAYKIGIDEVHELVRKYNRKEISISKMTETINNKTK